LEALAEYDAHILDVQKPPSAKALEGNMNSDKEEPVAKLPILFLR
jgi:hypothetical protein